MSFTKNLGRFEDDMRTMREKRTEPGWSFCDYFMVQVTDPLSLVPQFPGDGGGRGSVGVVGGVDLGVWRWQSGCWIVEWEGVLVGWQSGGCCLMSEWVDEWIGCSAWVDRGSVCHWLMEETVQPFWRATR